LVTEIYSARNKSLDLQNLEKYDKSIMLNHLERVGYGFKKYMGILN